MNTRRHPKHGLKNDYPKEYQAYRSMLARCKNPNHPSYERYGGRGILVCEEWQASFWAFFEHVGQCPDPEWSLDRIDNSLGYSPGNVRWASPEVQANNRRNRVKPPVDSPISHEPAKRGRPRKRRKAAPPAYLLHKGSGQAYVNYHGKERYLGTYGSPESRKRYQEFIGEWQQELDQVRANIRYIARPGCTVAELVAAHSEHAREHYRHADGTPTSEVRAFALSLRPLLGADYRDMPAAEFRPAHLKAIRERWIAAGHARKTVNQAAGRIRRLFRWAAGEELVSVDAVAALGFVADLGEGRTAAPDHEPVVPVPLRDLAATLRELDRTTPAVSAMIRLQYYCGARPGEVCRMRADEIDRGGLVAVGARRIQLPGGVWVFQPGQNKTGRAVYVLGCRARAILRGIEPSADGWMFPSRRRRGRPWSVSGYQHAIADAARAAGAGHWSPGQLRHNFLTRIDAAAGIQTAGHAVGHTSIDTTAIYVERNLREVAEVIGKMG